MRGRARRWIAGGFVLLITLVGAFIVASLLFPEGLGVPSAFQISPSEVTLRPGQGWQFQAVQEGNPVRGVKWTATGGEIGPEGFYTAPSKPGEYQVMAHHPSQDYSATATVHVAQDATETPSVPPTPTTSGTVPAATSPLPTSTPRRPTLTPTRTPMPVPMTGLDNRKDLVDFDTLKPVTDAPPGSDIKLACFDKERRLMRAIPSELAGEVEDWDTEENLILWVVFYEPVPETPDVAISWLFALDTDNDPTTGRPLGAGAINPDIGPEATIGVRLSATGDIYPYTYVWSAESSDSELADISLEVHLSATREAVFVRVPAQDLSNAIRDLSQTEPGWDKTIGRAATLMTTGTRTVMDFSPERPKETPLSDQDDDGVPDHQDKCPDEPGLPILSGCPDSDGDGVADPHDRCPDRSGEFEGCPDSDGDGVHDGDDRCPDVQGVPEHSGCPKPSEPTATEVPAPPEEPTNPPPRE